MKFKIAALLVVVSLWSVALAQTPKRRGATDRKPPVATQPQPVAQPPATSQPAPSRPTGPISLVTVNGQNITTADLEPALRQELERLDDRIAAARNSVLEL